MKRITSITLAMLIIFTILTPVYAQKVYLSPFVNIDWNLTELPDISNSVILNCLSDDIIYGDDTVDAQTSARITNEVRVMLENVDFVPADKPDYNEKEYLVYLCFGEENWPSTGVIINIYLFEDGMGVCEELRHEYKSNYAYVYFDTTEIIKKLNDLMIEPTEKYLAQIEQEALENKIARAKYQTEVTDFKKHCVIDVAKNENSTFSVNSSGIVDYVELGIASYRTVSDNKQHYVLYLTPRPLNSDPVYFITDSIDSNNKMSFRGRRFYQDNYDNKYYIDDLQEGKRGITATLTIGSDGVLNRAYVYLGAGFVYDTDKIRVSGAFKDHGNIKFTLPEKADETKTETVNLTAVDSANVTVIKTPKILSERSSKELEIYDTTYTCSFEAELDDTFRNTWVYNISDKGHLNVKFMKVTGNVTAIIDINGYTYAPVRSHHSLSLNNSGKFDFTNTENVLRAGKIIAYNYEYESNLLCLNMEKVNGVPQITLSLHVASPWVAANGGYKMLSSVIEVDSSTVSESGEAVNVWNIKGTDGGFVTGSEEESIYAAQNEEKLREELKEKLESYNDPNTPIDYSPDSIDPRRWDDKEKAIEAYGMYKDENGNLKGVTQITGTLAGGEVNHNVSIKAEFEADLRKTDLSTDGKVKATYYVLALHYGYMPDRKGEVQLLHLKGDKGEMWLASGNIDVRRPDPNVEIDEGNMLTDDSSIYVQFKEIDFDGSRYEYVDEETAVGGGLTFRYNDESKIALKGLELKYDGRQASLVPLEEIDYTGGLATFFLNAVYPENYKEIAKEMGIEL